VAYCFAQDTEIGGAIGYGVYRDGSIYAPGGKAEAGLRNRFAAGAVLGEDLYQGARRGLATLHHFHTAGAQRHSSTDCSQATRSPSNSGSPQGKRIITRRFIVPNLLCRLNPPAQS